MIVIYDATDCYYPAITEYHCYVVCVRIYLEIHFDVHKLLGLKHFRMHHRQVYRLTCNLLSIGADFAIQ